MKSFVHDSSRDELAEKSGEERWRENNDRMCQFFCALFAGLCFVRLAFFEFANRTYEIFLRIEIRRDKMFGDKLGHAVSELRCDFIHDRNRTDSNHAGSNFSGSRTQALVAG